jgi:hypothetical protein
MVKHATISLKFTTKFENNKGQMLDQVSLQFEKQFDALKN